MGVGHELSCYCLYQRGLPGAVLAGNYVEARLKLDLIRVAKTLEVQDLEFGDVHVCVCVLMLHTNCRTSVPINWL